jgi:hypothetical protein
LHVRGPLHEKYQRGALADGGGDEAGHAPYAVGELPHDDGAHDGGTAEDGHAEPDLAHAEALHHDLLRKVADDESEEVF